MKRLLERILRASFGLVVNGAGLYLMLQASIGLAPWDVLSVALSMHLPLSYGSIVMLIGFLLIGINLLLGEPIGIGMVLDALIVGSTADLLSALDLIPAQTALLSGVLCMLLGLVLVAVSQWIYMSAGLGCGPRDALFVALGKRLPRVPIGVVQSILLCVVLAAGWLLGGPVGLGTLIAVFGLGAILQGVFSLVHFDPRSVTHESIIQSLRAARHAET
mgnify:FL=1